MSQNNRHCHSNMSRHRSKWTEISVIRRQRVKFAPVNPLSPNSDQHQISPCNINAYSIPEVMRIKNIMITQGDFP